MGVGVGVGLEVKVLIFFFFKNDNLFLFQSRSEDLTHNVCDCVLLSIHVSSVYCSKIDLSF